jgi:hypothetical protein
LMAFRYRAVSGSLFFSPSVRIALDHGSPFSVRASPAARRPMDSRRSIWKTISFLVHQLVEVAYWFWSSTASGCSSG